MLIFTKKLSAAWKLLYTHIYMYVYMLSVCVYVNTQHTYAHTPKYMHFFYLYAYKYTPHGSKCDLPQVFFCISTHSIISKGERMIKLFFLVKQKTR